MPRRRTTYEPRSADNIARQRNAIGIAVVVLAALAFWQWSQHSSPAPPPAPPAQPTLVRLRR